MPQVPSQPPDSLLQDLISDGQIAPSDTFEALTGGRTNQVWRVNTSGTAKVLKLFDPFSTNPLFANDPQSETICLKALGSTGLSPHLIRSGRHPTGPWIIYNHVCGDTWNQNITLVSSLLGKVHGHSKLAGLRTGPNGSDDISRQTTDIIALCKTENRARLAELKPHGSVAPLQKVRLVHGDPVPGNIILNQQSAVLIDWQCPVIGDPSEDLSLFLSPAMQLLYRNTTLSRSEESRFLQTYPNNEIVVRYHNLKPWYHWRMIAYCHWRTEQGDQDYANALALERAHLNACALTYHAGP